MVTCIKNLQECPNLFSSIWRHLLTITTQTWQNLNLNFRAKNFHLETVWILAPKIFATFFHNSCTLNFRAKNVVLFQSLNFGAKIQIGYLGRKMKFFKGGRKLKLFISRLHCRANFTESHKPVCAVDRAQFSPADYETPTFVHLSCLSQITKLSFQNLYFWKVP